VAHLALCPGRASGPDARISFEEVGYLVDLEEGWYSLTNQNLGFQGTTGVRRIHPDGSVESL
jgi:hypothetical protein